MSKPPRSIVVDNPYSGTPYCEVPLACEAEAVSLITRSAAAQKDFARTRVSERVALVGRFADAALAMKETIARDISGMMGKPIAQARGEVDTLVARSRYMASVAEEALAEVPLPAVPSFHRKVIREPLGVVLDIAPWNYPLLTAVNAVVPAVLAGNSVVLKHASRTPLCGDHFVKAFEKAGAPRELVTSLNADHEVCAAMIARPEVGFVAFTGSVPGGQKVYASTARRFIDAGLELGGKDPGYVAPDADFDHAVGNLIDGAFYNAGQSCCGIERIYVHESLYSRFVDAAVALVKQYRLGDPMDEATTLGPLAQQGADAFLAKQVDEARSKGARVLCGGAATKVDGQGRFFEPCVVADATHGMSIMVEESFGPVVGIASVRDDDEALRLMNDSHYGLTCAIWTSDESRAERMARRLETGTVFMNRCDYLDPALPWVGVKDSGKGLTLSKWGFQALTRMKSLHFRLSTR